MNKMLSVIALSLAISGAATAATVLKLGHAAESTHPYGKGADHFAELVKQKSKGEIEVKVFPSSSLGTHKQLVEGVIFGTIDMALTATADLGSIQPQIGVFDMPFLLKDRAHAFKALDTVGMEFGKLLEPKGIKLLGYMENGIRHVTNNVRPVKSPADMKGLKIRVQNNKVYVEMMKAMGELYSALQAGVVDGEENPAAQIYTQRFYEVQKYASLTGHSYAAEPVLMSMATWKKLTPEQQAIIQSAATEAVAWQRKLAESEDAELWDKIKKTGKMEVIAVDRKPFLEATAPVYKLLAPTVGQENIDKIRALEK